MSSALGLLRWYQSWCVNGTRGASQRQSLPRHKAGVSVEIVPNSGPRKVDADAALAVDALPLIATHSVNGTDAMILRSALDIATTHRVDGDDLVLVTSDQRLLRAAQAEGLVTFNPETQDQTALAALLGP